MQRETDVGKNHRRRANDAEQGQRNLGRNDKTGRSLRPLHLLRLTQKCLFKMARSSDVIWEKDKWQRRLEDNIVF